MLSLSLPRSLITMAPQKFICLQDKTYPSNVVCLSSNWNGIDLVQCEGTYNFKTYIV